MEQDREVCSEGRAPCCESPGENREACGLGVPGQAESGALRDTTSDFTCSDGGARSDFL